MAFDISTEWLDPRDFGAAGDGLAITKALDAQTREGAECVRLPRGVTWDIDTPIYAGYGIEGFDCARLIGPGFGYRGETHFRSALIRAHHSNAPAICVQGARGSVIEGFAIKGANFDYIWQNDVGGVHAGKFQRAEQWVYDTDPAMWLSPDLHANAGSRYAPYAAIAIDPYSGARPAVSYPDINYPDNMGSVPQFGKAYSSLVTIRNIWMGGFAVLVAVQPCDDDSNGDFICIEDCQGEAFQYALSVGNTQARNTVLRRVQLTKGYCAITTNKHGRQNGRLGGTIQDISCNQVMQMHDLGGTSIAGPIIFDNCYMEAAWRLGTVLPGSSSETAIAYRGGKYQFEGQNDIRGVPARLLGIPNQDIPIRFENTALVNYRRVAVVDFAASTVEASAVTLVPASPPTTAYEKFAMNACGGLVLNRLGRGPKGQIRPKFVRYDLDSGNETGAAVADQVSLAGRSSCAFLYADAQGQRQYAIPERVQYIDKTFIADHSLVGKTLTLDFGSRDDWQFMQSGGLPGDILLDIWTGTVAFIRSRMGTVIIAEIQNNYRPDAASGFELLEAISWETGYFVLANTRHYTTGYPLVGNLVASKSTITATRDDGYAAWMPSEIAVDDYLAIDEHADRFVGPSGAQINAVAAGSLIINSPMSRSELHKRLVHFIRRGPANP